VPNDADNICRSIYRRVRIFIRGSARAFPCGMRGCAERTPLGCHSACINLPARPSAFPARAEFQSSNRTIAGLTLPNVFHGAPERRYAGAARVSFSPCGSSINLASGRLRAARDLIRARLFIYSRLVSARRRGSPASFIRLSRLRNQSDPLPRRGAEGGEVRER